MPNTCIGDLFSLCLILSFVDVFHVYMCYIFFFIYERLFIFSEYAHMLLLILTYCRNIIFCGYLFFCNLSIFKVFAEDDFHSWRFLSLLIWFVALNVSYLAWYESRYHLFTLTFGEYHIAVVALNPHIPEMAAQWGLGADSTMYLIFCIFLDNRTNVFCVANFS